MIMLGSGDGGGRERRKNLRIRIPIKAQLEARPRAPVSCDIYNVSVGGALLSCNLGLYLGQSVVLHMEGFDALPAHITRVTSTVLALMFDDPDMAALEAYILNHQQQAGLDVPAAGLLTD